MDTSVWNLDSRVHVFRDDQTLLLKVQDVTVPRLSRVFKIKPQTLFLEEEVTMNAEFAEEGKFHLTLLPGNRYKVCGDPEEGPGGEVPAPSSSGSMLQCPSASMPGPSTRGWSIPRPWMSTGQRMPLSNSVNPPRGKKLQPQGYEPFLKRSFPFVTLSLDHTGKNIAIESTSENVYVKIPESSVSVPAILSEIGMKVSIQSEELVILDSKYIHVTDDKDLEYWKTSSRRLYVAKWEEYDQLRKQISKNRLTLGRKRKIHVDLTDDDDDERNPSQARIDKNIQTVMQDISQLKASVSAIQSEQTRKIKAEVTRELLVFLECKICKDVPTPPVVLLLCCSQIMGCERCFESCMQASDSCPLCRAADPTTMQLLGQDGLYSFLKESDDDLPQFNIG